MEVFLLAVRKGLTLTDVLITVVIALVFAIIYSIWGGVYTALQPLGLHLIERFSGRWFMAPAVAYPIIRKRAVATIAELEAPSGETMATLRFPVMIMVYGLLRAL